MRTFNLEKCLKEIDHQWSNYKGDYSRYYIDGYYQAQKDCLEIIKSNIQKKSIPKNPFWKEFKNTGV
jgi:hypothetical protein